MEIKNITKKTIISKKTDIAKTSIQKAFGLMFKKPKPLLFIFNKDQIISLHMFFVFYPIDVIFIDSNKKVVEIKEDFKPFSYYKPKNKSKYVLELPIGTIGKSKTKVADTISF